MFEIGSSLRDARVRQGLELADLEEQTKVRARYLRALEEEQFEVLPGESYVRGFLRLYAERLGLDGQLYVDEYNSRFANAEEPVVASRTRRRAQTSKTESRAFLIALTGVVIVTALVIAAWRFGTDPGGEGTLPGDTVGGADTTTVAAEEPGPPATAISLAVAAVRGPTDLTVRRGGAAGTPVWEGRLGQGETSDSFEGEQLWVEVSKPANVEFTIDGFRVDRPPGKGPLALIASADGLSLAPAP